MPLMLPGDTRADHTVGGLGVGGLARTGSNAGSAAAGAVGRDRGYTRYRPIAPKPLTLKLGESAGSTASDPPSSSTLSFERSTASSSGSRGGKKRARKRGGAEPQLPQLPPVPLPPAPAAPMGAVRGTMMLPGMPAGMIIPPDKSVLQPMLPIPSAGEVVGRPDQLAGEMSGALPLPTIGYGAYRPVKEDRPAARMAMGEVVSAGNEHLLNVGQGTGTVLGPGQGQGQGPGQRFDRKRYGYGFGALKVAENSTIPGSDWPPRTSSILVDTRSSQPPATTMNSSGGEPAAAAFMNNRVVAAAAASIPPPYFQFQKEWQQGLQRGSSDGLAAAGSGGAGAPHAMGMPGIDPLLPPGMLRSGIGFPNVVHSSMGPPSQIGRDSVPASSVASQSSRLVEGASYSPATGGSRGSPTTPSGGAVVDGETFSSSSSYNNNKTNNANRGAELVTLSLLPDTPSLQKKPPLRPSPSPSPSSPNEHAPFLSLSVGGPELRLWEGAGEGKDEQKPANLAKAGGGPDESRNLRLFSKPHGQEDKEFDGRMLQLRDAGTRVQYGQSSSADTQQPRADAGDGRRLAQVSSLDKVAMKPKLWAGEDSKSAAPVVVDNAYMEENYSTGEPMMLAITETRVPLWENQAYKKEFAKRDPGGVWPYLDPLGCPTKLASFLYQLPEGPIVNATLWIFLTTIRSCESAVTNLLGVGAGRDEDGRGSNNNGDGGVQASQKKPSVKSGDDFPGSLQGSQTKLSKGQSQGHAQLPGSQWRRR